MVEILRFLADYCGFLFEPGHFRFVDSRTSPSNGGSAVVLLESSAIRMRLTWSRSELLMEFQPIKGKHSEWFSLGLLRGALLGDRGGSEVLDPQWAAFLERSLDELERRLNDPDTAAELVHELQRQARLRAKSLFG
jgi:hypothetical protein